MDPVRFGRQIRALRRRRGWRQVDLAMSARTSQAAVSRLELGHIDGLTLRAVEAIAGALAARIDIRLSWNGEALDRLTDAEHGGLVEAIATILRRLGWDVAVEVSFNIRGERGSIDVLAYHPATRIVLVVEVKSVIPDVQASLFVLDRKTRLAAQIARERGWQVAGVARLLVVGETRTNRRRVAEHATTFGVAFPLRGVDVRRWLREPNQGTSVSGLLFLSDMRQTGARHRIAGARRSKMHEEGSRAGPGPDTYS